MMVALCFIIALPLLAIFKIISENYLIAPLPPDVVAFFGRFGRDIEPFADGELGRGYLHDLSVSRFVSLQIFFMLFILWKLLTSANTRLEQTIGGRGVTASITHKKVSGTVLSLMFFEQASRPSRPTMTTPAKTTPFR